MVFEEGWELMGSFSSARTFSQLPLGKMRFVRGIPLPTVTALGVFRTGCADGQRTKDS